jgi:hypothetical protein
MEYQKINRPQSLQDWKKEFGIKEASFFIKKDNTTPLPKKLEIDFSELKRSRLSANKKTERQQYTRVIGVITVMLSVLVVGVSSYKQPINESKLIKNFYNEKNLKKPSLISYPLKQETTSTPANLTNISTIIENIYFYYPEKKLFSFKVDKKSRNNTTKTLRSRLEDNSLRKVADENITKKIFIK